MPKYKAYITRTITEGGYIVIEAESEEKAWDYLDETIPETDPKLLDDAFSPTFADADDWLVEEIEEVEEKA